MASVADVGDDDAAAIAISCLQDADRDIRREHILPLLMLQHRLVDSWGRVFLGFVKFPPAGQLLKRSTLTHHGP